MSRNDPDDGLGSRLDRRSVLRRGLALGVAATLAGCSGGGGGDGTTAAEDDESDGGGDTATTTAEDGDGMDSETTTEETTTTPTPGVSKAWSTSLDADRVSGTNYVTDASADTVAVANDGGLFALAASDGTKRWSWSEETSFEELLVRDGTVYATVGNKLIAFDAKSGDVTWRKSGSYGKLAMGDGFLATTKGGDLAVLSPSDGSKQRVIRYVGGYFLETDGEKVFAGGGYQTEAYNATTGESLWEIEGLSIGQPTAVIGDTMVASGSDGFILVNTSDGSKRSVSVSDYSSGPVHAAGSRAVQFDQFSKDKQLFALDPAAGDVAWSKTLDGTIFNGSAVTSGAAVVTTNESISAFDVESGDPIGDTSVGRHLAVEANDAMAFACGESVTAFEINR